MAAFYTGLVKSGFAFGGGLLVTPTLANVISAKESLAIVLPLLFLSDIVNFGLFWGHWDVSVALLPLPGAAVGIILATRVLTRMPEFWLKKTIGILALIFVPVQLARMTLWQDITPAALGSQWITVFGLSVGLFAGIFSTMAHLGGVVTTVYFLLALPTEGINASLVATSTVLYVWMNLLKLFTYSRIGIVNRDILRLIPRLIPMLIVGLLVGKGINMALGGGRVDWFIYAVLALVTVMGFKLVTAKNGSAAPPADVAVDKA